MRITTKSIRRGAIGIFLAASSLLVGSLLVPAFTVVFERYKMIEPTADLIVAAGKATLHLVTTPWFAWAAGSGMGLATGFVVGVWLDALMKRREDAQPPKSANAPENTEKDRQTLALEAHTAELQRANELRRQESDPLHVALMKHAEQQAEEILEKGKFGQKQFTNRTATELLDYYRNGLTPLQAGKLVQPHVGLWIRVEGAAMMILDGGMDVVVVIQNSGYTFECRFEKKWETSLMRFNKGDVMSVVGKVSPSQNGQQLYMSSCELES